mmetsp:Transcript_43302/g.131776  ORF Transcript_43302/g.131776 Transcript_43302/m.131776 type:complete len:291 (-) Transcript_43302:620-1492(-)|eukprot:CAMPEP_0113564668 /NCGR_PEP_ID=MMETSP0015_2-20120614/21748_1 /TAXON_ID=2838 /ORGANISM="Odontella" /LENGTH=290 /DNA_ID=CAMNT_0000466777 /DNA_START=293 /DNA_END=1165 /DNA_ORIENTATION=- /assembly_acc=CAM_ASM_000160
MANARLFCLYGIADSSASMRRWSTSSPEWLETRIVELPGHGYLTKGLPPCSVKVPEPLKSPELEDQRSEWVRGLTDQIEHLLVDEKQDTVPYAIYGFSFGAMMAYLICEELESRGLPPPLALFACGRGAPHVIPFSFQLQQQLQLWNNEQILEFIGSKMEPRTSTISDNRRERISSLFRCGMLFSCLHAGDESDESFLDSIDLLWDDADTPVPFASNLPQVVCPVISITGSLDTTWPPLLVEKWCDSTQQHYQHHCIDGFPHSNLMNAAETRDIVFKELARLVQKSITTS